MSDQELVYKTRIVHKKPALQDDARNIFEDPDEAKKYLEGYLDVRFNAEVGEWREENSANAKWSTYPDGIDGRAVVMGLQLRKDADELIEKTKEMVEDLNLHQ